MLEKFCAIVLIGLTLVGLLMAAHEHGHVKTEKKHFGWSLFGHAVTLALLYGAGAFNSLFR